MTPAPWCDPDTGLPEPDPGGPLKLWSEPVAATVQHAGMTWEEWLERVIDAPACGVTRSAFLDWLQELDGHRYGPDNRWWRDFTRPEGSWAVEARHYFTPDGSDQWWTVLVWEYPGGGSGTGMVPGVRLPACHQCGGRTTEGGRRYSTRDGWKCEACLYDAEEELRYGGLYPGLGTTPAVGSEWEDIPF